MPIFARISATLVCVSSRFSPSRTICPSARCSGYSSYIRFSVRSSVDLPQPDGPMNAVTFFSGISSEMFFSAWNLP